MTVASKRTSTNKPHAEPQITRKTEPRGPATIALDLRIELQKLELLGWAISARVDGEEIETFVSPIHQARAAIARLAAELEAKAVDA